MGKGVRKAMLFCAMSEQIADSSEKLYADDDRTQCGWKREERIGKDYLKTGWCGSLLVAGNAIVVATGRPSVICCGS